MICWIASYPRSGNTLFRIVLNRLYDISTYSIYGDPDIVRMGMQDAVGHCPLPGPPGVCRKSDKVYFVKTHSGTPQDGSLAVYIVRDGRDAIVSHAHYRQDVEHARGSLAEIMMQLIETHPLFGGWRGNVASWSVRPHHTVFVRFEDMVEQPIETVVSALGNFGDDRIRGVMRREWNQVELPTFDHLHEQFPRFFRKGKVGAWRDEMPDHVQKLFWDYSHDMMKAYGYADV